jgi:hypothetical protein
VRAQRGNLLRPFFFQEEELFMKMKFIGKRMSKYHGADGFGGHMQLNRGDECVVSEKVGQALLRHYYMDFEVIPEDSAKEHAPEKNKSMPKGAKFKSK